LIAASTLTKRFGEILAVDSLDFTVNKGEIFGIVGPDGAGKSTLLRMISSILIPDNGSISINGLDVHKNSYRIKELLAYMPQRFGLYEDLTVEENIYFFGRMFQLSKAEIKKRLVNLYSFSRLGPFKDRLAGQLSGGMKQKLGLACALVHTPEILLLDEPTNGVDPVSRREFWDILYELLARGVTIIVTTAYLDEAERSNRIALMYRGKFIRYGTPASIKNESKLKMLKIIATDSKQTEAILKKIGDIHAIRTGNSLRFFTDSIQKSRMRIERLPGTLRAGIVSIEEAAPRLEDSFIEIVSGEEAR
jgi:ABC-2 type transport system ATP-binding protein